MQQASHACCSLLTRAVRTPYAFPTSYPNSLSVMPWLYPGHLHDSLKLLRLVTLREMDAGVR